MLDLTAVNGAIKEILTNYGGNQFTVVPGNPLALPADGSPFAAFWFDGDADPPEGDTTFGNLMNLYVYTVRCFWHRQPELATQESFQGEIAAAMQGLRAAFWQDYTLGGTCDRIAVGRASTDPDGFFPLQARNGVPLRWYYTAEFVLNVWELEGAEIHA